MVPEFKMAAVNLEVVLAKWLCVVFDGFLDCYACLQSVAGISHHSALSEDRIRQCVTSSAFRRNWTQIGVCKSPFPSTGNAVSLFRAKMVQYHIAKEGQNPVVGLLGSTLGKS